jgi:hypothetical protein
MTSSRKGRADKKSKRKDCGTTEEIRDFSSINQCKIKIVLEEEE